MPKIKLTVLVGMYCSNEAPRLVDVDAMQVGRLAVHRHVMWFRGEEPKASNRYWQVSHIGTGLSVETAIPSELRNRLGVRRRDLAAWAEAWQRDPNVAKLLDLTDAAVAKGGQFARPENTQELRDVTYAAREAGWQLSN